VNRDLHDVGVLEKCAFDLETRDVLASVTQIVFLSVHKKQNTILSSGYVAIVRWNTSGSVPA
jgi:hypothetical protein